MQKVIKHILIIIALISSPIATFAQEIDNKAQFPETTQSPDTISINSIDSIGDDFSKEEYEVINTLLNFLSSGVNLDSQTEKKSKKKSEKNFKFSILGGPGYSPDYGFTIGLSTLMTFRTIKSDTLLPRSVIPINFNVSFGNPIGFTLISKPFIYFKNDKIRLQGLFQYKHTGEHYYGIGYTTNRSVERGKKITGYNTDLIQINPLLLFRIKKSPSYIGPVLDIYHENIKDPGSFVINDPWYINQGGTENGLKESNFGIGVAYSYDTRDVAANAYKGMLFEARTLYYGRSKEFGSITLDYRQFHKVSKTHRRILAWNVLVKTKIGDVPFSQQSVVGGPFNLRGYYMGQYRDNTAVSAEIEWRHMWDIATDTKFKRLLHRLGYTAWAGCGFMGKNIVNYNAILPNLGGGLRIEVQKRMNFRVDAGYSFVDKHALIYFNMTEAF